MSRNPEYSELGMRAPPEVAKLRPDNDCTFCAVDFGSRRELTGPHAMQRVSDRSRQTAQVAQWIISLDPEILIVVQDHTLFDTCLTHVLDEVYRDHPVSLHRTGGMKPDYALAAAVLTACGAATTFEETNHSEHSLLQRIHRINRIDSRIATTVAARLAPSVNTGALQTTAHAVARISAAARRTIVLGEWTELAILQFWLKDWVGPDEPIPSPGEADSYI